MNYKKLAEDLIEKMAANKKGPPNDLNERVQGEMFVLWRLEQEREIIPKDIAECMNVSSARVAVILNELEKKGFITREIATDDRRKIIVKLTEQGKEAARSKMSALIEKAAELLQALGEHDAKEFVRIIGKLSELKIDSAEIKENNQKNA